MLKVENLQKDYGSFRALKGLSFTIAPGQIVGLLGPNGAGKTTLIKILTGTFEQSAGTVTIAGHDTLTAFSQIKPLLGYLPENAPLYPELSVQDNILWLGQLRGMSAGRLYTRFKAVVEATDLWDVLHKPVAQLSKGFKQRVGLAQALLDEPQLLILDEPTNGLDPTQIAKILALIKGLQDKTTVIFSTHILAQVEECCDRALIIMNGELQADITLDNQATAPLTLTLAAGEPAAQIQQRLLEETNIRGCEITENNDGTTTLNLQSAPSLQQIFKKLSSGQF